MRGNPPKRGSQPLAAYCGAGLRAAMPPFLAESFLEIESVAVSEGIILGPALKDVDAVESATALCVVLPETIPPGKPNLAFSAVFCGAEPPSVTVLRSYSSHG